MWTEIQQYLAQFGSEVAGYLPTLLAAIAVLVIGWILARFLAFLVKKALDRTELDNQIAEWVSGRKGGAQLEVERWVSRGVFYLLMIFVLVAFFQIVGLPGVTEPLNRFLVEVFAYLPRLLGPALLALVAWILASVLRFLLLHLLEGLDIDNRFAEQARKDPDEEAETRVVPVSRTLSETVYWLVWLLFLPAILGPLGLQGILEPVQNLVDQLLGFLPQILAALLILAVGWFVARIVQRIVSGLLAAVGVDRFSDQMGLSTALGKQRLSSLLGTIVYVLILVPVLIAALDALKIEAITRPASQMLNTVLLAIPNIFAAALVIAIAYLVGKVIAGLVTNILTSLGFNVVLQKIGLTHKPVEGRRTPSEVVGSFTLIALLLLATTEAADLLGFDMVGEFVGQFVVFGGRVLLGLVIFGLGLYLANLAADAVRNSRATESGVLALVARVAIIVLTAAMALRQMGLANEIIQLAFGLTVGAVAVAVALAFGLGARDVAARQVENWQKSLKGSRGSRETDS